MMQLQSDWSHMYRSDAFFTVTSTAPCMCIHCRSSTVLPTLQMQLDCAYMYRCDSLWSSAAGR